MYHEIIYKTENFEILKRELISFRARVTANKLHSLGVNAAEFSMLIDEENYVPIDSRGL